MLFVIHIWTINQICTTENHTFQFLVLSLLAVMPHFDRVVEAFVFFAYKMFLIVMCISQQNYTRYH